MEERRRDPARDQEVDRRERSVREARDDERERRDSKELAGRAIEDEQADEAADPDRPGREVQPVGRHREAARRGLSSVPGEARHEQAGGCGPERAGRCEQLGDGAHWAVRPVEPERDRGGDSEQR